MPKRVDPELRARLLEAAAEEFALQGFASATLDGVGARAGVTKGGVYFHFRSKEDLFFAALDRARERVRSTVEDGAWRRARGAGALQGFLAEYLGACFRSPGGHRLLRVLGTEMRGRFTATLRPDTREEQRWLRARVRELLVQGSREGGLFAEDPASAAFLVVGAVWGVLDQWAEAPADVEPFCDAVQLAAGLVAPYRTGRELIGGDQDAMRPGAD